MNRYTLALFLFFLATLPVAGQERLTLSERPSTQSLETAKQLIKSAETAATKLAVAGYALIDIKLTGKLTNYVVPGSDDCLTTVAIPKGTVFQGWFYVGTELTWVKIAAVDVDRLLVTGTKKGTATIIWMTVKDNEAVVVAAFQFDVAGGKPKPVPDDPVNPTSDLALIALADIKAGKGTADDVAAYANLYLMYGTEVKNGKTYATTAELNKAMNTEIDRLLGEDIGKTLPSLRRAIGAELVSKVPTITNPSTKIADVKSVISEELLSIYKRLEGVK